MRRTSSREGRLSSLLRTASQSLVNGVYCELIKVSETTLGYILLISDTRAGPSYIGLFFVISGECSHTDAEISLKACFYRNLCGERACAFLAGGRHQLANEKGNRVGNADFCR